MRKRPLIFLSTVAAATLLLAGCAGGAAPESSSTPEPTAASSCALDAKSGATSDSVVVDGEGADTKVTVPADAAFAGVERTVISEGDGDEIGVNDLVSVQYQIVDAKSGEVVDSSARGEDGLLPVLLDTNQSSLFVAALECKPVGSRIVLTLPGSMLGEGVGNVVVYAEAVEHLPEVATGTPVDPTPGMPTVKLDDKGAPTITIPDEDAPTETEVAVLKQGDGPTVGAGDLVVVQYKGVKWSDGEEFDSSWSRDAAPSQFQTSGVVVGFKKALEGQKVGSQVVVKMPPSEAYGGDATSELQKESLVFVVDILATTPVQQQQK
ncbi:FKBP-type peptidyl-prolyl cis-trans isomerase [Microbacterium sp. W4I20]|uniref:FKBP-type peptidyl-prolyl cis-trans isomerase n=1 Tax=Microbacterium sp. W4I20 TaxID=3042262 RepID=UPI00278A9743|nr:FKBP-type peptidyl-prolyl cis-trans isomerase [Microbacterium sp. W4I20]MDQ0725795.1 FKBP-type peptidyl-prolyl cis-trans isomerase [Microbacterium sp. W4I20]